MKIKGDKQEKTLQIKIVVIGEEFIGKTSIIERYVTKTFSANDSFGYVHLKRLEINNFDVDIEITDTAGQERFRSITKMYYQSSDGILLGFDLTNKNTFEKVSYWIQHIEDNKSTKHPLCIVLFGNKCDAIEDIEINNDDIETMKEKYNLEYFSTNAKDNINVQNTFEYLIKSILKTRGLLKNIGLSPDISFDDIIIKEKENQKFEGNKISKRKKKKPPCIV